MFRGRRGRDRMGLDLQLPVQSVPITTKGVSSNSVHGEVYSIQYYVIKFVSDLRQVGGFFFSPGTMVSSTNNTDCRDITEILLKVALNTINQTNLFLVTWLFKKYCTFLILK